MLNWEIYINDKYSFGYYKFICVANILSLFLFFSEKKKNIEKNDFYKKKK